MNLLLVEDDIPLGQALRAVLQTQAFATTWVRSAEAARRFVRDESFDLLLLDIGLPGQSGLEFLRELRERQAGICVLIITARDAVSDRVFGLDSGADDYLIKPFAMEELLSRIRALLRRHTEHRSSLWRVGSLCIDTVGRRVLNGETVIPLTPREFEVLLQLAARPGEVLTRLELARGSNTLDPLDSNGVDFQIHGLRKKLGNESIGTVRGVGYFLDGEER